MKLDTNRTKMLPTNYFKNFLFWVDVTGDSMSPVLRSGHSYLASAWRSPRVGRIVVFVHPDSPHQRMVKRVVKITDQGYEVAGENAQSVSSDYIGVVAKYDIIGTLFRS